MTYEYGQPDPRPWMLLYRYTSMKVYDLVMATIAIPQREKVAFVSSGPVIGAAIVTCLDGSKTLV